MKNSTAFAAAELVSLFARGAALILSTAFATPAFAQIPEPGDYAFSQEPGLSAFYRPSGDLRIGIR